MLSYVKHIMFIFLTINLFASVNFTDPTSTTGTSVPNLSVDSRDANRPQITASSTGRYVYAIWERQNEGSTNYIIQVAISSDYGINWVNPTTVTGTSVPNLSLNGKEAQYSQITTSSTGQYVYATWRRQDDVTNKMDCTSCNIFKLWS